MNSSAFIKACNGIDGEWTVNKEVGFTHQVYSTDLVASTHTVTYHMMYTAICDHSQPLTRLGVQD